MTTNNDDTNVANNVAQGNSQHLTEQWKKGELEQGYYYVEEDGKTFISICRKHYLLQVLQDCKVLAPVPSYEEWKQLHKFLEEFNALDVAKENKKLKELLKECRNCVTRQIYGSPTRQYFEGVFDDELLTKIDDAIGEKK